VAELSPAQVDEINILQASLKAMTNAYLEIATENAFCLIDGNKLPPNLPCPARAIIKGDSKSKSIAAASIIAKVTRDRIMRALHEEFPHYGWNTNVGYPSKAHREAIDQHGITPHHRKSFAPVKNFLNHGTTQNPNKTAA
ncbi:MAG: ribonuclease HII, partial [Alphaproteobacteria bacterium]